MPKRNSRTLAAVFMALALVALSAAGTWAAPPGPTDQTLRVAIGIDPDTLDPLAQTTTLVAMIVNHMVEPLVELTADGEFLPRLATEWTVSEDNRTYTFKLREGVQFHDGTPFNADAVKFSLERYFDPTIVKPLGGFVGPLERVDVIDEYTVAVTYSEPFAPAMMGIAAGFPTMGIISPTAYEKMGREEFSLAPVGTGPFVMGEWIRGNRLVMERNENYWGEPAIPARIEWIVVPEPGTRSAMVMAGDVDVAYQPPPADIPRLDAAPDVNVSSVPSTRIMFVAQNTTKEPLTDKRVRQALNYAIDSKAIAARILHGAGTPDDAPIPASFFGYHPTGSYDHDPEKARQLLAEAGYPNGFELVFMHPTGRYLLDAQVAQAVQAYLSAVGVRATLQTMDWPTYMGMAGKPAEESEYHLIMLGWGPLPDAHHTLFAMFHSSQRPPAALNTGHYFNPEADRLIEQGATTLDPEERREIYRKAQEIIWDDAPWIFLYTQNMILGVRDNLHGLVTYPWEMFDLTRAWRE